MMESERAKKWIADTSDPLKSTSGMTHAVELAEGDARKRAKMAFCIARCNGLMRKDCDERRGATEYDRLWGSVVRTLSEGNICESLIHFQRIYDHLATGQTQCPKR